MSSVPNMAVDLESPCLPSPEGLEPNHISVTGCRWTQSALVDRWGRRFALRRRMRIGRDPEHVDIAIFGDAVSSVHAEICLRSDRWLVRDLGSTNGTLVGDKRVTEPTVVRDGQIVVFGDVGFLFSSPPR